MLAGLLIVAMVSGAVASVIALTLGLPLWTAFLAYPLAGSAALILGGALVALAGSRQARTLDLAAAQLQPLRIHQPR